MVGYRRREIIKFRGWKPLPQKVCFFANRALWISKFYYLLDYRVDRL
mgnify:FL=1